MISDSGTWARAVYWMTIAAFVLAIPAMAVTALVLSPVLIPYGILRHRSGKPIADRFLANVLLTLGIILIAARIIMGGQ